MRPSRTSGERRRWMAVLGRASVDDLERAWLEVDDPPPYRVLHAWKRDRVAVRLDGGTTGEAPPGARHPELAALFDALLQQPERRLVLEWEVVAPLERLQHDRADAAKWLSTAVHRNVHRRSGPGEGPGPGA